MVQIMFLPHQSDFTFLPSTKKTVFPKHPCIYTGPVWLKLTCRLEVLFVTSRPGHRVSDIILHGPSLSSHTSSR